MLLARGNGRERHECRSHTIRRELANTRINIFSVKSGYILKYTSQVKEEKVLYQTDSEENVLVSMAKHCRH